jgi:hypothetical protein
LAIGLKLAALTQADPAGTIRGAAGVQSAYAGKGDIG